MSIKVMTAVWDRFNASGSELLAMLALADWCADDGGSLWPSIKKLAIKIRVSESQARRVLHKLIDDGFVEVVGNEGGGAPGMTRHYRINVDRIMGLPNIETGSTHATPSIDATPSTHARDGSHPCAETGSTHATLTVSRSVKEPSKEKTPRHGGNKSPLITFSEFIDRCREIGESAVPEADPIFQWADDAEIPDDYLTIAWREFSARYKSEPKKYRDWRAVFRKAVRENWLKLWYADQATGEYRLTTAGVQAERVHRSAA